MLNKQCRGKSAGGKSAQTNKNPSKKGNSVSKYEDKNGMEYRPVPKNPSWDGAGEKKDWSA